MHGTLTFFVSVLDVLQVGMGSGGESMILIVKGEPFMELKMTDYSMDDLGTLFSKLQPK